MPTAAPTRHDDQLAFQVFTALVGIATLVLAMERAFLPHRGILTAVPAAVAVVMLWKPSDTRIVLAFWVSYAACLFAGLPENNTNQTLLLFLSLGMLVSAAQVAGRTRQLSGADWYRASAPVLRMCLVILYAWATFDKLNTDFLNPAVSCARALTSQMLGRFFVHPSADLYAAPSVALTILAEGGLAIGLLFRRTRRVTALFGMVFHWFLGFAGYWGFSATMMAGLSLFLFPAAARALDGHDGRSPFGPFSRVAFNRAMLVAFVCAVLLAKFAFGVDPNWLGLKVWYFIPPIAAILFWNNRAPAFDWRDTGNEPPVWWDIAHPRAIYLIALVHFANGLSPYLGYKTEYSYAMYSNLRTEGGTTNHVLWKTPLPLAHYQTDLVTVVATSDTVLLELPDGTRSNLMPRYVLQQRVQRLASAGRANILVVYTDSAGRHEIGAAEKDAGLMTAPSFVERKLLRFRSIGPAKAGQCEH
ncbi:MAG TPA: hypothetical protein VE967_09785 [Gemmatimonadaceae bacterium]|nr:hypothetical protein [Gemmatimonadaceae bacterium]